MFQFAVGADAAEPFAAEKQCFYVQNLAAYTSVFVDPYASSLVGPGAYAETHGVADMRDAVAQKLWLPSP